MILRTRMKNPDIVMMVGMSFLVLGILSRLFLHSRPMLSPNLADAVTGLFFGIAIGLLLVSTWALRSGSSNSR